MDKIFKPILWIAAIATISSVFLQFQSSNNEIEAKLITQTLLTAPIEVDGLHSSYTYKGKKIRRLWSLKYLLTNIGDQSIVGTGEKSSLINNELKLNINENYQILESVSGSSEFSLTNRANVLFLSFLQWHSGESVEVSLYLSEKNAQEPPSIFINEKELLNGKIVYALLVDNENDRIFLYKYLPSRLVDFLKWLVIIVLGLLAFLMPIAAIIEIKKHSQYKRCKKDNHIAINKLIASDSSTPKDLKDWNQDNWDALGVEKIEIPDKNTIFAVFFIFIILIVLILFMV